MFLSLQVTLKNRSNALAWNPMEAYTFTVANEDYKLVKTILLLYCTAYIEVDLRTTLCPKKNIPNIFDCNLKTNYQIFIIFGTNIPDTSCHQSVSYTHLTLPTNREV